LLLSFSFHPLLLLYYFLVLFSLIITLIVIFSSNFPPTSFTCIISIFFFDLYISNFSLRNVIPLYHFYVFMRQNICFPIFRYLVLVFYCILLLFVVASYVVFLGMLFCEQFYFLFVSFDFDFNLLILICFISLVPSFCSIFLAALPLHAFAELLLYFLIFPFLYQIFPT
jgi:hypothetical protein